MKVTLLTVLIVMLVGILGYGTFVHPGVLVDVSNRPLAIDRLAAKSQAEMALPVTLIFGGDMMFDRHIRSMMRKYGNEHPLSSLRSILASADAVVANLEGPITSQASVSETSVIGSAENYRFTFDPSVAAILNDFNISVVNLGNNHSLNFGKAGILETKKYLTDVGVAFFGSPLDMDQRILIRPFHGVRIAFVNYNQFISSGKRVALEDIATARGSADYVVVYAHWGEEYKPVLDTVKTLAREFIDTGADLVIGSHPHIIQESEIYQGKVIYYSLGNFVFDQYLQPETQQGILVRATLDIQDRSIVTEEITLQMKPNGQTVIANPH